MSEIPTGRSATPTLPDAAYERMAQVLRAGLAVSLGVLVGSLVVHLVRHPGTTAQQAIAQNPILAYLTATGLAQGLANGTAEAYLTLGLLLLIATPLLRVASGFYYFRRGGERGMAAVTLTVLAMLLIGILVIGPLVR